MKMNSLNIHNGGTEGNRFDDRRVYSGRSLQIQEAVTKNNIVNTEFANVELYHKVPDVFKKGETFLFKGKVLK